MLVIQQVSTSALMWIGFKNESYNLASSIQCYLSLEQHDTLGDIGANCLSFSPKLSKNQKRLG